MFSSPSLMPNVSSANSRTMRLVKGPARVNATRPSTSLPVRPWRASRAMPVMRFRQPVHNPRLKPHNGLASYVDRGGADADRLRLGRGALGSHEPERARERGFEVAPIDDQIEHAALDEELAALKSLGELLPDRLLDDARARESNQGLRFGDVQIAKHRKAGGDAAGGRIGQH